MKKPILQVALDVTELRRAVKIAKEAIEGGVDWLEVGTPLIKSEGMAAIRELRSHFKDYTIVADMKTMDTGTMEVEMAAKSGASVVTIMGVAGDATIRDALQGARKYGAELMIDLMNTDAVKRSKEVEQLGVDYLCTHVGIDQQMVGQETLDFFKDVKDKVNLPVAACGGLDASTASETVKLGADIIIVGGNICRSANVTESARRIREAIDKPEMKPKKRSVEAETSDLLMKISTPNISDAMHRKGTMQGIKPLFKPIKMVGKATTVQTFRGDWAKPVEATDTAGKGGVIVIYAGGHEVAPWGELASWSCKQKGIAGVVIDGAVRDVDEIRRIKFPVFARHISPTAGEPKGYGEVNVQITCGNQEVNPGDWVVGDDNGVVVIPKDRSYEIARRGMEIFKSEERVREEIKRGSTLSQVLDLYKWEKK